MRNIKLKRTITSLLNIYGRGLIIQHVKEHQDKRVPYEELPWSAQIKVLCARGCRQQLLRGLGEDEIEEKRERMQATTAYRMIDGVPVTNTNKEALAWKKYAPVVEKYIGTRKEALLKIDRKGHSCDLK